MGKSVLLICDDTDVFVLAVHYIFYKAMPIQVYMESPKRERKILDLNSTVTENLSIIPGLLEAYVLTGCDTVASFYGIGKGTTIKVLRAGWNTQIIEIHCSYLVKIFSLR